MEGRGIARGEIGLASIDAVCTELDLYQFIDSASYARLRIQLQILDPVEVTYVARKHIASMKASVEMLGNICLFPFVLVLWYS